MDPNAALKAMLETLDMHQFKAARDHAEDLMNWLDKGGFMPDVDRAVFRSLIRHIRTGAFAQTVLER